jgi:Flp pilus assembly pilin Flp
MSPHRERAQGMVEYLLITTLVAAAAIGGVALFGSATGSSLGEIFSSISAHI